MRQFVETLVSPEHPIKKPMQIMYMNIFTLKNSWTLFKINKTLMEHFKNYKNPNI